MDKIYRRSTQHSDTPKKPKNEKNRVRNTIMNFRVSPQEKELINARIEASGLTKSKFIIQSCLYQTILVKGNIKTFGEMKSKMSELAEAIDKNSNLVELDPQMRESLRIILEIINSIYGKE